MEDCEHGIRGFWVFRQQLGEKLGTEQLPRIEEFWEKKLRIVCGATITFARKSFIKDASLEEIFHWDIKDASLEEIFHWEIDSSCALDEKLPEQKVKGFQNFEKTAPSMKKAAGLLGLTQVCHMNAMGDEKMVKPLVKCSLALLSDATKISSKKGAG
ncbi:hypothetical protein SELMODRAFT_425417 [Selaginella moellendorffii]|uniref:Uncharacterized protein n=1 Tax=Selaginella moellendorffii TaxID=88036 RepID=D8ST16_SELML|nr:hypothetical protein SELMODRAFT_425417 [Selaginella moellendorffii]